MHSHHHYHRRRRLKTRVLPFQGEPFYLRESVRVVKSYLRSGKSVFLSGRDPHYNIMIEGVRLNKSGLLQVRIRGDFFHVICRGMIADLHSRRVFWTTVSETERLIDCDYHVLYECLDLVLF
jgi:hypothetical protein